LFARPRLKTRKKLAPPDADAFVGVPDKFAKYFSPNPGEGDYLW
jgi:ferredoxin